MNMNIKLLSSLIIVLGCTVLSSGKPVDEVPPETININKQSDSELDAQQVGNEKGNADRNPNKNDNYDTQENIRNEAILLKPNTTYAENRNCSVNNGSNECIGVPGYVKQMMDYISNNKGMVQRTFYVLIGVTGIIVIYFVIKTYRLRRRRSKSRKYGVISTRGDDNLEMTPLDQDDEEDDMTVFEINGRPK